MREDLLDMPWQRDDDDNLRFDGPLADFMGLIKVSYEQDTERGTDNPELGEYVTATAIVLREVMIEYFSDDPEAKEFVERLSDGLKEDDNGAVHVATFEMLDDMAEHIEPDALEHWMSTFAIRGAIVELATTAFA
ncbi:MAG: hypothetical protein HGB10_05065 [Coriobacteriia bacterium]|nr:hypothetical protein [Coriobacteriia bacterium]